MLRRTKWGLMTATLLASAGASADAPRFLLLAPSGLPNNAPPFDRLHDGDYRPAIEAAVAEHGRQIAAIANDPAAPSFNNTIVAMERSGADLTRAVQIFENLTQANTNDALDAAKEAIDPALQAHRDSIYLDAKPFARIRTLHARMAELHLAPNEAFLLDRTYRDFVHAGAALSEADKARLRDINQKISKLTTSFQQRLLAATAAGAVAIEDKAELAGLGEDELAAAASAAAAKKSAGKYLLPLRNTTQQPVLAHLENRDLRASILAASESRGTSGPDDMRDLVATIAVLRADKAKLLGFPTYAAYQLSEQMAKTPEAAFKLMDSMVGPATASARRQAAEMDEIARSEGKNFKIAAYDWEMYADKLRHKKFALSDAATRPYFELNRVLRDGVFFAANKLYGITVRERHDLPVYQPDVRTFEIFDADGKSIALFYADYFARPNKQGGAWCDDLVPPSGLLDQKPVVVNVANFTKPAPGKPALLSFDDVTTAFHEFGHALHTIFSVQHFPSQNGFGMPTDVIEFPSQFNEHWALDPEVLANYAHHYETGAPLPAELAEKLREAKTFDQGYKLTEYLAAALLDMEWHSIAPGSRKPDAEAFERAALHKHAIDLDIVPPRYRTTYFAHIWGGGYAANYYAYLWGEVLDDDAYAWFEENGGLTRANGDKFRRMVLGTGYTADPMEVYRAFRGRDPSVEPLLKTRGIAG